MMNLSNFDWVRARADCSLAKVFKELELGVKRETNRGPQSVEFSLVNDEIHISNGSVRLVATLTLNKNGQCKLKVKDEELEQWQVRRMALEDLFFAQTFMLSASGRASRDKGN